MRTDASCYASSSSSEAVGADRGFGGEALEVLEAWRPDVLVSDSAAPEHDSYALVGKVCSLEAHRGGRIPAAALTTFVATDERVRQMLRTRRTATCRSRWSRRS